MREVAKKQERWVNQLSKDMALTGLRQTLSVMVDCRQQVQKSLEEMQDENEKYNPYSFNEHECARCL
jgi:hypothetical protein